MHAARYRQNGGGVPTSLGWLRGVTTRHVFSLAARGFHGKADKCQGSIRNGKVRRKVRRRSDVPSSPARLRSHLFLDILYYLPIFTLKASILFGTRPPILCTEPVSPSLSLSLSLKNVQRRLPRCGRGRLCKHRGELQVLSRMVG